MKSLRFFLAFSTLSLPLYSSPCAVSDVEGSISTTWTASAVANTKQIKYSRGAYVTWNFQNMSIPGLGDIPLAWGRGRKTFHNVDRITQTTLRVHLENETETDEALNVTNTTDPCMDCECPKAFKACFNAQTQKLVNGRKNLKSGFWNFAYNGAIHVLDKVADLIPEVYNTPWDESPDDTCLGRYKHELITHETSDAAIEAQILAYEPTATNFRIVRHPWKKVDGGEQSWDQTVPINAEFRRTIPSPGTECPPSNTTSPEGFLRSECIDQPDHSPAEYPVPCPPQCNRPCRNNNNGEGRCCGRFGQPLCP